MEDIAHALQRATKRQRTFDDQHEIVLPAASGDSWWVLFHNKFVYRVDVCSRMCLCDALLKICEEKNKANESLLMPLRVSAVQVIEENGENKTKEIEKEESRSKGEGEEGIAKETEGRRDDAMQVDERKEAHDLTGDEEGRKEKESEDKGKEGEEKNNDEDAGDRVARRTRASRRSERPKVLVIQRVLKLRRDDGINDDLLPLPTRSLLHLIASYYVDDFGDAVDALEEDECEESDDEEDVYSLSEVSLKKECASVADFVHKFSGKSIFEWMEGAVSELCNLLVALDHEGATLPEEALIALFRLAALNIKVTQTSKEHHLLLAELCEDVVYRHTREKTTLAATDELKVSPSSLFSFLFVKLNYRNFVASSSRQPIDCIR